MLIKTIAEVTEGMKYIPIDDIFQGNPVSNPPCCVGAHLAHFLDVAEGDHADYMRGADEFARLLDVSRAHIVLLLRAAGAPHDPFGREIWKVPVAEVWTKLKTIEEMPSVLNADFSQCELGRANLAYYDFTGCNFQAANLCDAFMHDAVFNQCDFTEAKLIDADVSRSEFEGATFDLADLEGCYFHEAKDAKPMDEPPDGDEWLL